MTPFTRREMIVYAVGITLVLSALFIYNILTLVPQLSGFTLRFQIVAICGYYAGSHRRVLLCLYPY